MEFGSCCLTGGSSEGENQGSGEGRKGGCGGMSVRVNLLRAPTEHPSLPRYTHAHRPGHHTHSDMNPPIPLNTHNWPPLHFITYSFKQSGVCWAWARYWGDAFLPIRSSEHIQIPKCTSPHTVLTLTHSILNGRGMWREEVPVTTPSSLSVGSFPRGNQGRV